MRLNLIYPFLILLFVSCAEQESYVFEEEVDVSLMPFFQSFASEAASHGIIIDWTKEQITGTLGEVSADASGQCLKYSNGRREVLIDKDYWSRINQNEKEFVIYHELGHCMLNREHLDEMDERGFCISIMTSGEFDCQKRYNQNTRNRYIEELFLNQN